MRNFLKNTKKIVVKVGTSILTSPEGRISSRHLERLGRDVQGVLAQGRQAALVSSGAIAYGMETCGFKKRPKHLSALQACAAIGQGKLMRAYDQFFSRKKVITAQLLLTRDGLEDRERFLAARRTFEELFAMNALPIVNENDTVATEEIAFGDNDILSVHVAHLIRADLLVILSDVNGFFLKDGSRIRQVSSEHEIDHELVKHLQDTRKEKNVGGMKAKLEAARVAMRLGVSMMIVNGHEKGILGKVLSGDDVGTLFWADPKPHNARKEWIAFSAPRKGTVTVDQGAYDALCLKKKSLLASGIRSLKGTFEKGDVVELATMEDRVFGRGVVRFGSQDLEKILGKKTDEIIPILGPDSSGEVIHRNDLLLWV